MLSLPEIVFGSIGHILNLFLLLANGRKVVKDNFNDSLISESRKFFNSLPLIHFLLESDPPLCEGNLKDMDTFFL